MTEQRLLPAAPVEDQGVEFMATSATGASGSLALGATDAGCTGCAGKFVQTQVKTSTAFPYAAIGAQLRQTPKRGMSMPYACKPAGTREGALIKEGNPPASAISHPSISITCQQPEALTGFAGAPQDN